MFEAVGVALVGLHDVSADHELVFLLAAVIQHEGDGLTCLDLDHIGSETELAEVEDDVSVLVGDDLVGA